MPPRLWNLPATLAIGSPCGIFAHTPATGMPAASAIGRTRMSAIHYVIIAIDGLVSLGIGATLSYLVL